MGVLNYLKSVLPKRDMPYKAWMSNSAPIFTSFGRDIYLSDFVNNAIDRIASEVSKIEIKSVVQSGDAITVQNDDITRLFRFKPNPLQTTSDFLSNVEWLRRKNRNAFIYPQFENVSMNGRVFKRYIALYPLRPSGIYIGVNNGMPWEVKMDFEDGTTYTIPYADLIHLRWRQGANTIVGGGDDYGMVNDSDVRSTIDALNKTIQGLPKSIEASLQIKGVYSSKSMAEAAKINKMRDDFEDHIKTSASGMIVTSFAGDFTPVKIDTPNIPEPAMKFLKSIIQERYGVSAAILSGDYTGDQHDAFYQTAIEDVIVQLEQAMTACLFTPREQDVGHRIRCYYSKVNYMSTAAKNDLANLSKDIGLMTLNQIAEMYGFEPFEGGNRRVQSLNYMNVEKVDAYQEGKAGVAAGQEADETIGGVGVK